jgi:membrane protein implicated in regulation of membrane protease activity
MKMFSFDEEKAKKAAKILVAFIMIICIMIMAQLMIIMIGLLITIYQNNKEVCDFFCYWQKGLCAILLIVFCWVTIYTCLILCENESKKEEKIDNDDVLT